MMDTTSSSSSSPTFAVVPPMAGAAPQQQQPPRFFRAYRDGFRTSICDLFSNPYDRSSCCAITCCGTFLHDRTKYILTGERPPPWWFRLVVWIGGFLGSVVVGLFVGALLGMGGLGVFLGPILFVVGMLMRASDLRVQLRRQIIQQIQQQQQQQGLAMPVSDDNQQSSLAHCCCSCVPKDVMYRLATINDHNEHSTTASSSSSSFSMDQEYQKDCCSSLWQLVAMSCCGGCGCWWNCNGMCATGQEERELRRILPKESFMIDYITMQPWQEYFPAIEELRRQQMQSPQGIAEHFALLSDLSRRLAYILLATIGVLLIASVLHILNNFSPLKVIVVCGTLFQAAVIMYLVHWMKHRHDLSLDAVIKFFASGFVLSVPVTLFLESIMSLTATILFYLVFDVEFAEENPGYDPNVENPYTTAEKIKQFSKEHLGTIMVYLFFQNFIVAGVVEELAKFFCFWMVEHPDFVEGPSSGPETPEDTSPQTQTSEHEFTFDNNGHHHHGTNSAVNGGGSTSNGNPNATFVPREDPGVYSKAAAITVGMVATAAGFACCENLMYVFGQGHTLRGEIEILFARSALPVHPICAAIQSIGIVRRDIERDPHFRFGKAVFPAIFLHGLFDFVQNAMAVVTAIDEPISDDILLADDYYNNNNNNQVVMQPDEGIPMSYLIVAAAIAAMGYVYYLFESARQRERLRALESVVGESRGGQLDFTID